MIHELIDALLGAVGIWFGYKIGYASHRANARPAQPLSAPKTPYRDAADAPPPLSESKPTPKREDEYMQFDPRAMVACPKCGGNGKRDNTGNKTHGYFQYCPGSRTHNINKSDAKCHASHFTRICDACNFSWFEATKDMSPTVDAPVISLVSNGDEQ